MISLKAVKPEQPSSKYSMQCNKWAIYFSMNSKIKYKVGQVWIYMHLPRNNNPLAYYISIYIDARHRKKGFATLALKKACFESELPQIYAVTREENSISRNALRSAGFRSTDDPLKLVWRLSWFTSTVDFSV